jgi:serine/threonine kinase PknH
MNDRGPQESDWPPPGYGPREYGPRAYAVPSRRGKGGFVAVGAVVVLVAAATVAVALGGDDTDAAQAPSPSPAPPPPPLPSGALPGLLLTQPELSAIIGADVPTAHPVKDTMYGNTIADAECIGLHHPAMGASYEGSGYLALRHQQLDSAASDPRFVDAVVSFPDAGDAARYVRVAELNWDTCSNRTINERNPAKEGAPDDLWTIGTVSESDGIVSAEKVREGASGWTCQRALAALNNIVIDFRICGSNLAPSVVPAVVTAINRKIQAAG